MIRQMTCLSQSENQKLTAQYANIVEQEIIEKYSHPVFLEVLFDNQK